METLGPSARHWRRHKKSASFKYSLSATPSFRGAFGVERLSNTVKLPTNPTASKKCQRQLLDCPCTRHNFLETGQREPLGRDLAVRPFPGLRKICSRRRRPQIQVQRHPFTRAKKESAKRHPVLSAHSFLEGSPMPSRCLSSLGGYPPGSTPRCTLRALA